mmetsp:Transcript_14487/g.23629  ORF Transcript_14487/g.23629 Transcript_14487/m.23629 type:complete len:208 (+) Transcript_14487:2113-2736(+)
MYRPAEFLPIFLYEIVSILHSREFEHTLQPLLFLIIDLLQPLRCAVLSLLCIVNLSLQIINSAFFSIHFPCYLPNLLRTLSDSAFRVLHRWIGITLGLHLLQTPTFPLQFLDIPTMLCINTLILRHLTLNPIRMILHLGQTILMILPLPLHLDIQRLGRSLNLHHFPLHLGMRLLNRTDTPLCLPLLFLQLLPLLLGLYGLCPLGIK